METHQHVFFQCKFSLECFTEMKKWLHMDISATSLQGIIRWMRNSNNSKFKKNVIAAGMTVVVYYIWQGRNNKYWLHCSPNISSSIRQIKHFVRIRVRLIMHKKISWRDYTWFLSFYKIVSMLMQSIVVVLSCSKVQPSWFVWLDFDLGVQFFEAMKILLLSNLIKVSFFEKTTL